jgi:hypothetical protein
VVCREDLSPTEGEVRDGALDDPVPRLRLHPATNGLDGDEPGTGGPSRGIATLQAADEIKMV